MARVVARTSTSSVSATDSPVIEPPMTTRVGVSSRPHRSKTAVAVVSTFTSMLQGEWTQLPATVRKAVLCIRAA